MGQTDEEKWERPRNTERQAVIARIAGTVILASSNLKARGFEEQSNKKRFYPDGVYCWGDSNALIAISTEGNSQVHIVLLNRQNYINMGTS